MLGLINNNFIPKKYCLFENYNRKYYWISNKLVILWISKGGHRLCYCDIPQIKNGADIILEVKVMWCERQFIGSQSGASAALVGRVVCVLFFYLFWYRGVPPRTLPAFFEKKMFTLIWFNLCFFFKLNLLKSTSVVEIK